MDLIEARLGEDYEGDDLLWVDHRSDDDGIIESLSDRLGADDAMTLEWRDDELWLQHRGAVHLVPLTMSPHDRYVAIGSVAELVRDRHGLYVRNDSLGGDTHALLVLSHAEVAAASKGARQLLGKHFTRVEPGTDYFGGPDVPFVGHADHNPQFAEQAAAFARQQDDVVKAVLDGPRMQAAMQDLRKDIDAQQRRRRWQRVAWIALALFVAIRIVRWLATKT